MFRRHSQCTYVVLIHPATTHANSETKVMVSTLNQLLQFQRHRVTPSLLHNYTSNHEKFHNPIPLEKYFSSLLPIVQLLIASQIITSQSESNGAVFQSQVSNVIDKLEEMYKMLQSLILQQRMPKSTLENTQEGMCRLYK